MSTKIYDAFIFDKQYSMKELSDLAAKWRNDIDAIMAKQYAKLFINEMIYYYDLYTIRDIDFIKKLLNDEEETNKNTRIKKVKTQLLENLCENGLLYLKINLDSLMCEWLKENRFLKYEFKGIMTIHPLENKTLTMIFGGKDVITYMKAQPELSDYHYQNQTEKPDKISDEEWDIRKNDWDNAIGYDYIPSHHGLSLELFNAESSISTSIVGNKIIHDPLSVPELIPDISSRARKIAETYDDYPNQEILKTNNTSEIMKYLRSDEYKEWFKNKTTEIESLINTDITNVIDALKL